MAWSKLADILTVDPKGSLKWQSLVPICTNPFTLVELTQMGLVSACVGLVIMASGMWIVGGGLHPGDLTLILAAAGVFLAAVVGVFWLVGLLFFGNRYFALYHLTPSGIYHQGTRGHDRSGRDWYFGIRPQPVDGFVTGKKSQEKELPWEKVDHFIDFASMRSVQLKRGRWHMLRLYTPDEKTHSLVVAYLSERLRQVKVGDSAIPA